MTDLADRVTRLEQRMDDVQRLAGRTDQEVASWRGVLNGHTHVLNGMSDRLELFRRNVDERFESLDAKMDKRFADVEAKMDGRFADVEAKMDGRFADVEANLHTLKAGMDHITNLLTPDQSDES